MQVILIKDLKRRGVFGDTVEVADGYARNFLIPNGFALAANNANKKRFSEIKDKELEKVTSLRKELTDTANQIKGKTFTMIALSRDGKLYGSVTAGTIANLIKEEISDIKINGSDIIIEEGNIKFVGKYTCKAQFTKEISSSFTVIIEADESDEQPELLEAILDEEEDSDSEVNEQETDAETTEEENSDSEDTKEEPVSEAEVSEEDVVTETNNSDDSESVDKN